MLRDGPTELPSADKAGKPNVYEVTFQEIDCGGLCRPSALSLFKETPGACANTRPGSQRPA